MNDAELKKAEKALIDAGHRLDTLQGEARRKALDEMWDPVKPLANDNLENCDAFVETRQVLLNMEELERAIEELTPDEHARFELLRAEVEAKRLQ